jgi:hypothetical protein
VTVYTLLRHLIRYVLAGGGRHTCFVRVAVNDSALQDILDRYDYRLHNATTASECVDFIVLGGILEDPWATEPADSPPAR